ncbi:hypothetical protein [Helicobacter cinaedi]|uniref:hypothetical protein n=1 Tax=Helicobacter cinaedi TaxID=213 RepID=UPI001FB1CDA5|nr:hypothetical protein [Helicobacter cinaedi]
MPTSQNTNPTQNVNSGETNRPKVNLATLLDSNKIIPHYESIRERILTGGGYTKLFTTHCCGISLVCEL